MGESIVELKARMQNPALMYPDAMEALQAVSRAAHGHGIAPATLELIHARVSQINGCAVCLAMHAQALKQSGTSDERLTAIAAWRETTYFTPAERAALALAEAATRLSDRSDPVPDEVWNEAARHYDEAALGALVISIAAINAWNRINVTTRQIAGSIPASATAHRR
ncbi:MAG TPA: carboxymuconolactone decarboxylase family protein [Stellaceae bacterium]|jgi:AhpD family alkylhydroperoxidase|nr:carboxymuconolactone decarboxylase family protein [Stellaceae bacterium]